MRYVEPVYRPPSEADSYLLHVTYGCSHNECTYCAMYRSKRFAVRPEAEILEDIAQAARVLPGVRRVFLLDGDALTAPTRRLVPVLEALGQAFPGLQRVGSYVNAVSILSKDDAELARLRALRLGIGYLGLESGDAEVNRRIVKGATLDEQVEAVRRAQAAGIKMSVMVLLGIAGRERSLAHAAATAEVLNAMDPRFVSCLCVTPVPGTPLWDDVQAGRFELPSPREILEELAVLVGGLRLSGAVFRSNHASNWLPLGGRLPADRERLLEAIDLARAGALPLKPDWLRGL
ncbi:MAG: radical SAM protein [Planctomycetia bacterium]